MAAEWPWRCLKRALLLFLMKCVDGPTEEAVTKIAKSVKKCFFYKFVVYTTIGLHYEWRDADARLGDVSNFLCLQSVHSSLVL